MSEDKTSLTPVIPPIEAKRISRDPLDSIQIGDFYWIKFEDTKWKGKGDDAKLVKVGEHEDLMCVDEIGSNFVGFTIYSEGHSSGCKIHFDVFAETCRAEPNWKVILNERMEQAQKAIRAKTAQLIEEGQKLCLLPNQVPPEASEQPKSLLPAKVSVDPKKHKAELVKLQKSLPEIAKEIEELGEEFAVAAKNISLPDMVKLESIKEALGVVEDRIFTIELYCGILEEVEQIAKGEPAPLSTPVTIRQQMLYMDEETLFDYKTGGMDFQKIKDFDKWVVDPANLDRILPEQRGIVAFRVRREGKDYGEARSIGEALAHFQWAEANKQTYILIRNGWNVYRIASEVDFTPRLIPKIGEIGEDQFTKIDTKYVWHDGGGTDRIEVKTLVTPESVHFDDHVKKVEQLLKHYNRIVILIQGLLDRSTVFHPHPVINLGNPKDMEKWVVLLRDEERALPSNRVQFEVYQKQINSTLRKGKWVYVDQNYDERYPGGQNPNYSGCRYQSPPKRGYATNRMPELCQIISMKRDGSAVHLSWPKGERSTPKKVWVDSKDRPGWGHEEHIYKTDQMCHEWIPTERVFNVSDYQMGGYKMFLCDRSLQGSYLKWAQYLLTAEDWARAREKGIPPEEDKKAKPK